MDHLTAAQWDGETMDRASYATGERPRVGDRVEAKGGALMAVVGLYAEQGIALCKAESGGVCRTLLDLTGWDGERRRRDAATACLRCPEPCAERLRCFPDGVLSEFNDHE